VLATCYDGYHVLFVSVILYKFVNHESVEQHRDFTDLTLTQTTRLLYFVGSEMTFQEVPCRCGAFTMLSKLSSYVTWSTC